MQNTIDKPVAQGIVRVDHRRGARPTVERRAARREDPWLRRESLRQKIINPEVSRKDKAGNPIVVRDVTVRAPADAIRIKTITQLGKYGQPSKKPQLELVAANVQEALEKAYNQPPTIARARTPLSSTNIYERTPIEVPRKITIIVQVPGTVTPDMISAADKVLAQNTSVAELPPVEVIVQTKQVMGGRK